MAVFYPIDAPNGSNVPVTVPITSGSQLDLTTVTAVTLNVLRADGKEVAWATTITVASSTSLTCQHILVPGDFTKPGVYVVRPLLTTTSGPWPCWPPTQFTVTGKFGAQ